MFDKISETSLKKALSLFSMGPNNPEHPWAKAEAEKKSRIASLLKQTSSQGKIDPNVDYRRDFSTPEIRAAHASLKRPSYNINVKSKFPAPDVQPIKGVPNITADDIDLGISGAGRETVLDSIGGSLGKATKSPLGRGAIGGGLGALLGLIATRGKGKGMRALSGGLGALLGGGATLAPEIMSGEAGGLIKKIDIGV